MKVVHVTTVDIGGAYKGALRLHESMKLCGVESEIVVRTQTDKGSPVIEFNHSLIRKVISKCINGINLLYKRGEIHGDRFGSDITKSSYIKNADVIFLHWVNSFLSMREIEKVAGMGKPVVWILHDMWPFTGGCHVDRRCGKYSRGCGACPLLGGKKEADVTRRNFEWKKKKALGSNLKIAGPSRWIVECAQKSPILAGKQIVFIPNTLDIITYRPLYQKKELRKKYGIDIISNKKIILFGAADDGTENPIKGFRYLLEALKTLPAEEYALVIFGKAGERVAQLRKFQTYCMGYIREEEKLREIYNLADVFVNPSLQESFGYTVCEAMACAIPVVAFNVGGNKDQIAHKKSGYLAEYRNSADLAKGIVYCAENTVELGKAAYQSAQNYSYEKIGKEYIGFCENLLAGERDSCG